jgi:SAM-dependent methyltransferase
MEPSELDALKGRLKSMWMAGDYGHFAKFLEPGAMPFFDALAIQPGQRVLDVACGAGQLSLPAARAGAQVTGVDIATNLIAQARSRATEAVLTIEFEEGDAEALALPDASFDLVFSLIGAMFAPRPDRVASEFLRVCRSGGRIAMGNWTPGGFIGQMFKLSAGFVPPPPGMPSPVLWGDEDTVRARFATGLSELRLSRRLYVIDYPFPPGEVVEFFRAFYGPTNRAFAALDETGQGALRQALEAHWSSANLAGPNGTRVEAEYLEVIGVRA